MNEMLNRLGMNAKAAETEMRNLSTNKKNEVLLAVADKLVKDAQTLINANRLDVETGKRNHMPEGLIDRLLLTESRIEGMAEGLRQVAALDDPVGEVTGMKKRPNGLLIGQKRVPLGVIGIIYEARPNVTADAFALCFKTGNVVILKGGSDAMISGFWLIWYYRCQNLFWQYWYFIMPLLIGIPILMHLFICLQRINLHCR